MVNHISIQIRKTRIIFDENDHEDGKVPFKSMIFQFSFSSHCSRCLLFLLHIPFSSRWKTTVSS